MFVYPWHWHCRQYDYEPQCRRIQTWLTQTREFRLLQTQADDFPLQYFFDLRPTLSRLRIEGTHLDEQELFDLLRSLDTIHQVVRFLNRTSDGEVASEGQRCALSLPFPATS